MSEEVLIKHCSPTLAGMKTGNMFTYSYKSTDEMRNTVRFWNRTFTSKGLRALPLKYDSKKALIYLYRPTLLLKDLQNKTACQILRKCGYKQSTPERCIAQLVRRMSECSEFPHEVGLFLGYPPEDVYGFIKNKAHCCKYCGCWKVYGDEEAAKKTFEKYKKCTEFYYNQYVNGNTIERLTVAD